jgi:mannose-6-phosphate isomerase
MLSIQSHPTKAAAEIGFKAENEQGVPIAAAHRNYKDDNHKPEVMVALTDFWLLHGFKTPKAIRTAIETVPEFDSLLPLLDQGSIKQLYKTIMEWPQERVNQILMPLSERLLKALEKNELHPDQADYWAAIGFRDMVQSPDKMDRGIFSIYLFNLVTMKPGQAIFQDAGIPHAYLRGVNVELMANSDNVFRGGLTKKHIDVKELMNNLVFDPVSPNIINGEKLSNTETAFRTPAPDFELRKIEIQPKEIHHNASTNSPAILILMEGKVLVNEQFILRRGEILFIPANIFCTIEATEEKSVLYKALVP